MKFTIITPTYKRKDALLRAVNSVLQQKHQDWQMVIINDSPEDASYADIMTELHDPRIHYIVNAVNSGVNFSRNEGIKNISSDSDYTIFLDDDDFLAEDALTVLSDLATAHPEEKWIITNRCIAGGKKLTKGPQNGTRLNYARDYLLLRRLSGDATHCIASRVIKDLRFAQTIKQGEEWLFYFTLGQSASFTYFDVNTTLSAGYDAAAGLNFRERRRLSEISGLIKEGVVRGIVYSPYFCLYIFLRIIRALF